MKSLSRIVSIMRILIIVLHVRIHMDVASQICEVAQIELVLKEHRRS